MSSEKYVVRLSGDERSQLESLVKTGKVAAYKRTHAQILLLADVGEGRAGWNDKRVAEACRVSERTVSRVRQRLVEQGLDVALARAPRGGLRKRKLDGEGEARLVTLCCGQPPEGRNRWTLQLLADDLVRLSVVESISPECVRQTLNRNELKPWRSKEWCIPPEANAEFVCAMEDVLEVHHRPHDPARPLVCMDESSKQQVIEVRTALPTEPGQPQRYDTEYERNGVSNLFMFFEPLTGRRDVDVTDQRTAVDWARQIRDLVDVRHAGAERVVLVMDNLNTHVLASLYKAFSPEEARRIVERLEIHYTPKHGSWLNMAEIELSILSRQCLDRRIPDQPTLKREVQAWQDPRNAKTAPMDWRFTTEDARIKLKRLYPTYID